MSKNRKEQILSCFQDTKVNFSDPNDLNEFGTLKENLQREADIGGENDGNVEILVEKNKFDKLIVIDDISGLADTSSDYSRF